MAQPGDRILRLHITGTLDLKVPDYIEDAESEEFEGIGRDAAIMAALNDGTWTEATGVEESEFGVLSDSGYVRSL